MYSFTKGLYLLGIVLPLSGCVISLSSMGDYSGTDAAKIRVANTSDPLSMKFYKKVGSCLQEIDSKSLAPGVNILGFKSTKFKKINDIEPLPEGSPLRGVDYMEYNIQPGQYLKVGYRTTSQTMYTQTLHTSYRSFIPKAGHSYETYTLRGGYYINPIMITDITNHKNDAAPEWDIKECDYNISLLGQKVYKP